MPLHAWMSRVWRGWTVSSTVATVRHEELEPRLPLREKGVKCTRSPQIARAENRLKGVGRNLSESHSETSKQKNSSRTPSGVQKLHTIEIRTHSLAIGLTDLDEIRNLYVCEIGKEMSHELEENRRWCDIPYLLPLFEITLPHGRVLAIDEDYDAGLHVFCHGVGASRTIELVPEQPSFALNLTSAPVEFATGI
ncbi:hypothetical protein EVAR_43859_1 [Eumeta japonica]|uniref:Uncharacterized protein n=1 Tax=Eumeta variegata TaxID=151549 RepID=A0A4C1X1B6_EUMVA|nr:hypothetical protein EVAR_43859_1 [Eumeta japonica]